MPPGIAVLAGGIIGRPGRLTEALGLRAAGVQVGTAFAFCRESGLREDLKKQVIELSRLGQARAFTDPVASPTGFPFKVVQLDGTLSDGRDTRSAGGFVTSVICAISIGVTTEPWVSVPGGAGGGLPEEGGRLEDTVGRKCVCNGLPRRWDRGRSGR
ncbi:MAG: hypothetical protein H7A46_17615 [Verrucomicrobiales bacterium]|nr:hypothetical protein [Verrucomicrobiales bacterium]